MKIKYIKELIAEDYLTEAIDEAKELFNESEFYDEVILISGRLSELDRKDRTGILNQQEEQTTKAQIRSSLLKIIRKSKRKPKKKEASGLNTRRKLSQTPNEKGFTDGDYITAAIVYNEHVEKNFKKLVRQLRETSKMPREEAFNLIEEKIEEEIERIKFKSVNFDKNDEEERLEACISKLVADVMERETANFAWNVEENESTHPYIVFKNTIKAYIQMEKEKWKEK